MLTCMASAGLAFAEDTDYQLDEILVTAQKRQQDIKDVPISITAFSERDIENARINSLQDYMELSPNVGFFTTGTPTENTITIRGVSNLGGYVNGLGVYVDEFNVSPGRVGSTYEQALLDLERIEVLRGPQGVLFGRNLIAGAINLTTRKPGPEFEARVAADYGSHNTWELKGAVNFPFGDRVALRASGFTRSSDGFLDDVGPADTNDSYDTDGGRLALRLMPTDAVTIDLTASRTEHSQGATDLVPTGVLADILLNLRVTTPVDSGQGFYPSNTDRIATDAPMSITNDTTLLTGHLDWDFGGFSLIGVTGYIDNDATDRGDGDLTAMPFYLDDRKIEVDSRSAELRLQSNGDRALDWVVGAAYTQDETSNDFLRVLQPAFMQFFGINASRSISDRIDLLDSESYAAFGDLTLKLGERFDVSAGGRYTRDEVTNTFFDNSQGFGNGVPANRLSTGTQKFTDFSPRFSAVYKATPELNLYGVASRGYKAGGHNLGLEQDPTLPTRFNKEVAWNFESGVKGQFLDNRLHANLALFYMKWSDIQVNAGFFNDQLILFQFVQNAAKASSKGVELELVAKATDRLQLQLAAGYNDAKFDEFPNGINDAGRVEDFSDNKLPLAPEWSVNSAAQYRFPVSNTMHGFARVEYAYKDEQFLRLTNRRILALYTPAYDTANVRFGLENDKYRLVVYGENLLDENVIGGNYVTYMSGVGLVLDRRRYGVQLAVSFD